MIMEPRLKQLEAKAGMKKYPLVFRSPMSSADRDMSSRNGNIIMVRLVESWILPGIRENSGAMRKTRSFEKNIPRMHMTEIMMEIEVRTLLTSLWVSSGLLFS